MCLMKTRISTRRLLLNCSSLRNSRERVMPIYVGTATDDKPEILLECWSIRETDNGDRHFVGFNTAHCDGRVSTPIVSFDPRTRLGVTSSCRQYRLIGRAGFDKDAEYVWNWAVRVWDISNWSDVTGQLCPDWRNPVPEAERTADSSRIDGCLTPPADAEGG